MAPTELEAVLRLHPSVADCAVVGVQRSTDESELPATYIVVRPGCKLAETEVHDFTRSRLAGYKQLRGGVRFIDQLPRNANGKVMKSELKIMLMQSIDNKARI